MSGTTPARQIPFGLRSPFPQFLPLVMKTLAPPPSTRAPRLSILGRFFFFHLSKLPMAQFSTCDGMFPTAE